MCGIAGAFNLREPIDQDGVRQMLRSLSRRGPDDERLIHLDGLTDAFVSHMTLSTRRPGHVSNAFRRFGYELSVIQNKRGWGPGIHRAAVEAGEAPEWVTDNLDAIEFLVQP